MFNHLPVDSHLLTYLLTYSMVQSPSTQSNCFAASQEIPRVSRNPKVHYRTHKLPPPVSILDQLNPVHIPTSHLLEIHPNIIHPSTPRSTQWPPSLRFPHQDPVHPLSSPIHSTCPTHLILLDFITRTILGEEYKSFSSSLCNLLHPPVTSSLLGPNIFLNTLVSNTLSFLSSRCANDQVSHPYKTAGKITVLYILILKFLDSNLDGHYRTKCVGNHVFIKLLSFYCCAGAGMNIVKRESISDTCKGANSVAVRNVFITGSLCNKALIHSPSWIQHINWRLKR